MKIKRASFVKSVAIGALWTLGVRPKSAPEWAVDDRMTILIREVWYRDDDGQWLLTRYTDGGDVIFRGPEQPPFSVVNAVTSLSSEVWTVERR